MVASPGGRHGAAREEWAVPCVDPPEQGMIDFLFFSERERARHGSIPFLYSTVKVLKAETVQQGIRVATQMRS